MSEALPARTVQFAGAARRVIRWLWLRKALRAMTRTVPFIAGLLAILIALRVMGFTWSSARLAATFILLWIVGAFLSAWWRKPQPYAALAFWDAQTKRSDAFANAWWFESQPQRNRGQEHHLAAQCGELQVALLSLRRDIPLPDLSWLAALPVLLLTLIIMPGNGRSLPGAKLTDEGRRIAGREGKKLAEKKIDAEKMKALSADEKKELENLQRDIAGTAKALEQQKSETVRDVLSELEKRARDAEKLAEKLGAGNLLWASDPMIAEMRRHADTAELGDAVANKSTDNTAKEAQKLSGMLRDEKLATETCDRLREMLREIGRQSQPEDSERIVGQHVLTADKDIAQSLPQEAGKEFQLLADKMRTMAARDKAREELEKLAQQLRDAGSNAAGQGTKGMSQLAGNQGQDGGQQPMMMMPNAPQMQSLQPPGMSNTSQGQGAQGPGQKVPMLTPAPGAGQDDKNPSPAPQNDRQGKGKENKPMLFAPVPKAPPSDQKPDTPMLVAIPGSNPGGLPPGNGAAPMNGKPTEKSKPGQQSVVNAQRNADGESSVRSVEGQVQNEAATRSAQATALDAIASEENALDDAALPPARREQVRRYFTELRKRFEKEN